MEEGRERMHVFYTFVVLDASAPLVCKYGMCLLA